MKVKVSTSDHLSRSSTSPDLLHLLPHVIDELSGRRVDGSGAVEHVERKSNLASNVKHVGREASDAVNRPAKDPQEVSAILTHRRI